MSEENFSFEAESNTGSGSGPRRSQMRRTQQGRRVAGRASSTPEGRNLGIEEVTPETSNTLADE